MVFRLGVRCVALAILACLTVGGDGQTLARRNWEGAGLAVQNWWSRALFCFGGGDLKGVVGQMDALAQMGCDAVEVDPGSGYGMAPEMSDLIEAVAQRKVRVVVNLVGGGIGEQDLRGKMEFWGARGAAGFVVSGAGGVNLLQAARGRLLIVDGEGGEAQLRIRQMPAEGAAGLRGWLSTVTGGKQGMGTLMAERETRLGYARAAILMLGGAAARMRVDAILPERERAVVTQEFPAEELLLWVPKERAASGRTKEWVNELSALRRRTPALRTGETVFLDFDDAGVVGWIIRARDMRSSVVVVCNVGGAGVGVALSTAVRRAGLKETSLRTLMRSDGAAGGADSLERVELGLDGVFVGEVR